MTVENTGAGDAPVDWDVLRSMLEAVEARDRASLAIVEAARALRAAQWFTRWCAERGISSQQVASTTQMANVIRAALEASDKPPKLQQ